MNLPDVSSEYPLTVDDEVWSNLDRYGDLEPGTGNALVLVRAVLDAAETEGSDWHDEESIAASRKILDGGAVNPREAESVSQAWMRVETGTGLPYGLAWNVAVLQAAYERTGIEAINEIDASDYFDARGMSKYVPGLDGFILSLSSEYAEHGVFGYAWESWKDIGREGVREAGKAVRNHLPNWFPEWTKKNPLKSAAISIAAVVVGAIMVSDIAVTVITSRITAKVKE